MGYLVERLREYAALEPHSRYAAMTMHEAADEIERLKAIDDRLDKTADGVSVTPGMDVWFAEPSPHCVHVIRLELGGFIETEFRGAPYRRAVTSETYSTREAVEAAGGK